MNINNLIFIFFVLFEQELVFSITPSGAKDVIYLPMKKNHKYGKDICYYREFDEKLDYYTYYVKPCEKGKYCEDVDPQLQPFGFCKDIPTNATQFPTLNQECATDNECPNTLKCDGTCKKECTGVSSLLVQYDYNNFQCINPSNTITFDEKYCQYYQPKYNPGNEYVIDRDSYNGKFPNKPKECGIISYIQISDKDYSSPTATSAFTPFTRYFEQGRKWSYIGEAEDGEFVSDEKFCKSGYTLLFYPNGDTKNPDDLHYNGNLIVNMEKMCVTPIEIDDSNPVVGCVITYKVKDGAEHKYRGSSTLCNDKDIVLKSKIYTEFIEEFNNSDDEDKINCYKLPQSSNCQNIKLLKLYYFYQHPNEYLFYNDRDDLEKVLHFKIQQAYPRYYEFTSYLNFNYIFFLLFLILL